MSDPHVVERIPYSPSAVQMSMSDGTILYGCSWPGCNFAAESPGSIGSHFKTHSGQAAQRRRARRRPKSDVSSNAILEAALALLDRVQDLVDLLDGWEAEHEELKKKAQRWDSLRETLNSQE